MTLKNYTSTVPATKSIAHIEAKLISKGANKILKEYEGQRVVSIAFILKIDGVEMPFKLPARVKNCETILRANVSSQARQQTLKKIPAQAERTAWKIVLDWVDVQMSMIELAQVDFMEVFLPYLYNSVTQKTYFEMLKTDGLQKLLPAVSEVTK